jgi:hypothetical protein
MSENTTNLHLTAVTPTVFIKRAGDELRQRVQVSIRNDGQPTTGTLVIRDTGVETTMHLPHISSGESVHDVFLAEPQERRDVQVELHAAGQLVDQLAVVVQPPRHWVVHVVQTSHHDLGYTDLASNVLRVHDQMLDDAIDMAHALRSVEDDARFRIVIEQAWSLEHFLRHARPARAGQMLELLRSGQFELNALYGNMTTELCSPEEMMRCLYPAFRLKREHGVPLLSAEHNDITGFSWGVAQVLADAGIKLFAPGLPLYYNWGRLGLESFWDEATIFGRNGPGCFWWRAPSGKRVLLWCNNTGCGGDSHPHLPGLADALQRLPEQGYPWSVLRWPVNGGARDNSPYTLGFAETIHQWNTTWAYPHLVCSTNARFYADFTQVLAAHATSLPEWPGELPGQDYPIGAISTAAATAVNRNTHAHLSAAEKLATAASLVTDLSPQQPTLNEAYEDVLVYDEHSWGHHFPAGPSAWAGQLEKAAHAHRGAALAHDVLNKGMARIADQVRLDGEGIPLVVFNMTGAVRTDMVQTPMRELDNCGSTMMQMPPAADGQGVGYLRGVLLQDRWHVNLPDEFMRGEFDLIDAETQASVPYQLVPIEPPSPTPYAAERAGLGAGTRRYGLFEMPTGISLDLCFIARDVPAHGYRTYCLAPRAANTPVRRKTRRSSRGTSIENEFYRVSFDKVRGAISSIFDKQAGVELLDAECPYPFGALIVRYPHGAEWVSSKARLRGVENGLVCSRLHVEAQTHGHPRVQHTVTLYAGLKRIEFAARILKDATPLLDVHLAFPFRVQEPEFRYEGIYTALNPATDFLPGAQIDRLTAQNWVKLSDAAHSVLWSALDAPVVSLGDLWPGYVSPAHRCQVTETLTQHRHVDLSAAPHGWVFSNLFNNNFGTNFSVSQVGDLLFRYSFTTTQGEMSDAEAALVGQQAVTPLLALLGETSPRAHLPPIASLIEVSDTRLQLLTLKRAEDGNGLIARLWNVSTEPVTAQLALPGITLRGARRTNGVEEDQEPLMLDAANASQTAVPVTVGPHDVVTLRLLLAE